MVAPVVVMGVSGSGKSTVGADLAEALGGVFLDGDDFHPVYNVGKMREDVPLTDVDRAPWLDAVAEAVAERRADGDIVGMVGMSMLREGYPFSPVVEIGWRLLPEFHGQGYSTEAAEAWLYLAFDVRGLDEVVTFCVIANRASEAVMQRLGFRQDGEFDHPSVDPATHPHLVRHRLYRLEREEWLDRRPR